MFNSNFMKCFFMSIIVILFIPLMVIEKCVLSL